MWRPLRGWNNPTERSTTVVTRKDTTLAKANTARKVPGEFNRSHAAANGTGPTRGKPDNHANNANDTSELAAPVIKQHLTRRRNRM